MEHNIFISDMYIGQELEGFYILKDAYPKTTATGKPFLSGYIADCTGSMELKVWDYAGPIAGGDAGKIIKIRGQVSDFKGSLQFTASRIRLADENDTYDVSALVPTAPIDVDAVMADICSC